MYCVPRKLACPPRAEDEPSRISVSLIPGDCARNACPPVANCYRDCRQQGKTRSTTAANTSNNGHLAIPKDRFFEHSCHLTSSGSLYPNKRRQYDAASIQRLGMCFPHGFDDPRSHPVRIGIRSRPAVFQVAFPAVLDRVDRNPDGCTAITYTITEFFKRGGFMSPRQSCISLPAPYSAR